MYFSPMSLPPSKKESEARGKTKKKPQQTRGYIAKQYTAITFSLNSTSDICQDGKRTWR
jgi:hypothetical protein